MTLHDAVELAIETPYIHAFPAITFVELVDKSTYQQTSSLEEISSSISLFFVDGWLSNKNWLDVLEQKG